MKSHDASLTKTVLLVSSLIAIVLVGAAVTRSRYSSTSYATTPNPSLEAVAPYDFENQTIVIDNAELKFSNGVYSGNGHTATISGRGASANGSRAAAIITDSTGGSGIFYYVVGASVEKGKKVFSKPMLLGDRVKILSVTVLDPEAHDFGEILVSYDDHGANEPMYTQPTNAKTAKFSFLETGELINVLH
jgi:hypothetical protein